MWRYPFGSGGKRVTTSETLPSRTSAATISRMKSLRSGVAGLWPVTPLLLIVSKRLVHYLAMSGRSHCHARLIAPDDAVHMQAFCVIARPNGRVPGSPEGTAAASKGELGSGREAMRAS